MSFSSSYRTMPPTRPTRNPSYDDPMRQVRNAQNVHISAELFEKLFLSQRNGAYAPRPSYQSDEEDVKTPPKADWRKSLANPTPIALVGIVIALTPLSCDLIGLLGAGGSGAAGVGTYYFFGGLLLILAALLEWFMGNTFPSVAFSAYGAFFLSFAITLTPSFGAFASYAPAGSDPSAGLTTRGFNASFGWSLLWMCVLSIIFLICSLRINVVLVLLFASLVGVYGTLSVAYFLLAGNYTRNHATATNWVKAGGVCGLIASLAAWWNLLSVMLTTVDFPLKLPLGDLSEWIVPGSERGKSMA